MVNPRRKGSNFERDIANLLSKEFNVKVRRTPCSGALDFMKQDIIVIDQRSLLFEFFMELKNREALNHHKVYWRTKDVAPTNKIPIVIHKKNRDIEPIVTIGLSDFINLLQRIEEKGEIQD